MSHTLYATFENPADAEKAAGELLDQGVRAEDLSVVRSPHDGYTPATEPHVTASNVLTDPADATADRADVANGDADPSEVDPTPQASSDAASSAWKGAGIGAGIGVVATLVALLVPGLGIVLGAGALASAVGGVAATAGVGAAAGAFNAYLKDAGLDEDDAETYDQTVRSGGAVLAVTVPSGTVEEDAANMILKRNSATNVNRYAARGYVA